MTKCKSCGAEIVWIKLASGKAMPCDAEPITYWPGKAVRIITPNGLVLSADLTGKAGQALGMGYLSHFATCPYADQHRKAREHT